MLLGDNLKAVQENIRLAAQKSGRSADEIQLIAVTKTWPVKVVEQAISFGLNSFGENYVQEALQKIEQIKTPVHWHFIGHLQSNKVRNIIGKFDYVHSVDSESVIKEFDKQSDNSKLQKVLLQVQFVTEESKSGVSVHDVPKFLDLIQGSRSLQLCGLMWMPPLDMEADMKRKYFAQFRDQREGWRKLISGQHHLNELSLGTTHDYALAIEEGSTMVRIGSALFGERK